LISIPFRPLRSATAALFAAVCASITIPVAASAPADAKPAGIAPMKAIAAPVQLLYGYKAGDVRMYKVTGFFSGHFPPFAAEGSPPIHLMTVLDYVATVKKISDKGAEVEFNVANAELSLLEEEPGPDAKVDPDKAAPFPIPLSQVQKMFNATATFQPNGAVSSIQGGDTSSVKIDLGIDLRKLFLVTAPVTFSAKPVKTGEAWQFDDGLLGTKPGKTAYTGKLEAITGNGKSVAATVSQHADSRVDSKLDKEGNSTEDAAAAVGTLVGTVTLDGTVQVAGAMAPVGGVTGATGRVTDGKLTMNAMLKRTMPDPDQPGKQLVTDIDIKARMFVEPLKPTAKVIPPKPAPAPTPAKVAHPKTTLPAKRAGKA
jgi:hypothetical protein